MALFGELYVIHETNINLPCVYLKGRFKMESTEYFKAFSRQLFSFGYKGTIWAYWIDLLLALVNKMVDY